MNRREKILAAAVGLMVLLFVANTGVKRLIGAFTSRMETVADLESEVQKRETMIERGKVAQRLLQTYKERSLPSDKDLASSRYRAWLHDWLEKAGVKADVKATAVIPHKQMHDRHTFSVVSSGVTLPQLVELLYQFYSTDYLHRIKLMSARPSEGKYLSVTFAIETISLPDADKDKVMKDIPAHRLMFDDLAIYKKGIVSRNLYAPANLPPKIVSSDSQRGYVNQPVSISVKAEDPEKLPVRFRLDGENPEGVKIDEESGRLTWTSAEKGEFAVNIVAFDDGIPSKEVAQTIRINIGDPPPPETPVVKRSFDQTKYTNVTGILEVNGRRQVWLTVRSDGKWLRLFEGETFEIGDYEGKIVKIHLREVEIQSQDETRLVRYGESISEGEVVSKDPSVAASN